MQKYQTLQSLGALARTQKRLCRNRLWKSGAGAPRLPCEGELAADGGLRGSSGEVGIGHLAPDGFACFTPLAESAICWRAETRYAQTRQHAGRK